MIAGERRPGSAPLHAFGRALIEYKSRNRLLQERMVNSMKKIMRGRAYRYKHKESKKAMPILSFPGVTLDGLTVTEALCAGELQAVNMIAVAEKCDMPAILTHSDETVESEAFGARVCFSSTGEPCLAGSTIKPADIETLKIPSPTAARTGEWIKAVAAAKRVLEKKAVFAAVTGPFTIASNLLGSHKAQELCHASPQQLKSLVIKTTEFLSDYLRELRFAGAEGAVIAEPAAAALGSGLGKAFSFEFIRRLTQTIAGDDFMILLDICGCGLPMLEDALTSEADGYIFGAGVSMPEILKLVPEDKLVFGNIAPSLFVGTDTELIRKTTVSLLDACGKNDNFVISSGGVIPASARWETINAFFSAVSEYYGTKFKIA